MAIELKTEPKYGYYPWWPENGNEWVHPEDVELARSMIPSQRVFRRDGQAGEYVVLHYGATQLRVRPTLWRELRWEGFDVGDLVEVRSRGMKNEHRTGTIRDVLWNDHTGEITYTLEEAHFPVDAVFTAADLKHVEPPKDREEVRIEPAEEDGSERYEVDNKE